MSNGGTHNELLEVPQDVPIVNVQDVPLLHDHDVVVMAISEALWGTRGSGREWVAVHTPLGSVRETMLHVLSRRKLFSGQVTYIVNCSVIIVKWIAWVPPLDDY